MGYLVMTVVVIVGGAAALAVVYVHHENRPAPPRAAVRRAARKPRRAAPGGLCACGGTLGRTGRISDKFGELLGCTGCDRSWTMDGRKIMRRTVRRPGGPRQVPGPSD